MSIQKFINERIIFTNINSDMISKSMIQSMCTTRGILSTLTNMGAKKKTVNKIEYFTNIKLNDIVDIIDNTSNTSNITTTGHVIINTNNSVKSNANTNTNINTNAINTFNTLQEKEIGNKLTMYESEMLKLKREELDFEKEMRRMEMTSNIELKQKEKEANIELQQMEKEANKELKIMEMNNDRELKQMKINADVELKKMEFAFYEKENNKNRNLLKETRHFVNKKLNDFANLKIYGTPSVQYIDMNCAYRSLILATHTAFHRLDTNMISLMKSHMEPLKQQQIIYYNNMSQPLNVIPALDFLNVCNQIVDSNNNNLEDKDNNKLLYTMNPLLEYVDNIRHNSNSDNNRIFNSFIDHQYESKLINEKSNKTMKDKEKYRNIINDAIVDNDDEVIIKCYTCGSKINLNSKMCERLHDLPKSNGGSFSIENIKLGCSNCNRNMSNNFNILEYKVKLIIDEVKNELQNKINDTEIELLKFVHDMYK